MATPKSNRMKNIWLRFRFFIYSLSLPLIPCRYLAAWPLRLIRYLFYWLSHRSDRLTLSQRHCRLMVTSLSVFDSWWVTTSLGVADWRTGYFICGGIAFRVSHSEYSIGCRLSPQKSATRRTSNCAISLAHAYFRYKKNLFVATFNLHNHKKVRAVWEFTWLRRINHKHVCTFI